VRDRSEAAPRARSANSGSGGSFLAAVVVVQLGLTLASIGYPATSAAGSAGWMLWATRAAEPVTAGDD